MGSWHGETIITRVVMRRRPNMGVCWDGMSQTRQCTGLGRQPNVADAGGGNRERLDEGRERGRKRCYRQVQANVHNAWRATHNRQVMQWLSVKYC